MSNPPCARCGKQNPAEIHTCTPQTAFNIGLRQPHAIRATLADSLETFNNPHDKREPLTDEEIWKLWLSRPEVPDGEDDSMEAEFVAAVRAVLAVHGIAGDANGEAK